IQQIEAFLVFLDDADQNGGVVVHCYAGQGRTGTMLACALVHQGMSAEEAIRLVRAMRPPSIDTLVQEQIIFDFAALRVKVTSRVQGDRHD
ncbi:MAG: dual specificity protein phosphatase family protein, partial [candidate division NC10 bacterium]